MKKVYKKYLAILSSIYSDTSCIVQLHFKRTIFLLRTTGSCCRCRRRLNRATAPPYHCTGRLHHHFDRPLNHHCVDRAGHNVQRDVSDPLEFRTTQVHAEWRLGDRRGRPFENLGVVISIKVDCRDDVRPDFCMRLPPTLLDG